MPDRFISTAELADASGAREEHIRYWIKHGILQPAKHAGRQGTPHGFSTEHIPEATQWHELTNAGLSSGQLSRIAAVQRAALDGLSPTERIVRRFELYISTIETLASVFGKGHGFDEWHARQQAQLAHMRVEVTPRAERRGRDRQHERHLLRLILAALKVKQQTTGTAIA